MGQIEDLRLFVAVVDSGGIARGADVLGIAKSAVSRRLSQLEDRYGLRLIDRHPGNWAVTTAGEELYQRAGRMVADADDLDMDFMHASQSLRGPLAITIAREFGLSFLTPTLLAFMETHPEIDLTVDFDDRTIDLDNENYDMAVRITDGALPGLINHRIGSTRLRLYASPSYAEKNGLPRNLTELTNHSLLHYGAARRAKWKFMEGARTREIEFKPALNSNNGPFLINAALNDLGIARLPDFVVKQAILDESLIPVLPDHQIADFGIYVVYSTQRRLNRRMRVLMETLERSCGSLI